MPKLLEREQDLWHVVFTGVFLLLIITTAYVFNYDFQVTAIRPFDFVILSLAVFRLIRLITYDSVTECVRRYCSKFESGPRKTIFDLIDCPWCTGVWAALSVAILYFFVPSAMILIIVLALAGAASSLQVIMWKIGRE